MTVKDVMTLLESPDRVRVIKDGEEIYNQYFANMEVDKDIVAQIGDAEVKRFRAIPEITHRKYEERGLIASMKPEETPDYSFRDLQLCREQGSHIHSTRWARGCTCTAADGDSRTTEVSCNR